MEKILDSKQIILNNVDLIFRECNRLKEDKNEELLKLVQECSELRDCNKKLLDEVSEKDKLLIVNEKKMIDYENMINHIQENAMKEKTEKERFDMLKKQDKEIHERDIEIKRLQKKVNSLEENLRMFDNEKIVVNVKDVEENVEGKILVDRMKHVKKQHDLDSGEETESLSDVENTEELKKETPVVDQETETPVVDQETETPVVDQETETPVVDNPNDKEEGETDSDSEEEGEEVEVITYYKKDYYVIVNENPRYIYMIDNDGELGEKVGEIHGKKKVFYNSSKN
jgi:hypothetical protein